MKKIKAILVLSAILFLCAFVFAACGPVSYTHLTLPTKA